MKAHPGDRIVLAPVVVEGALRDGEVLEVRGPGGTPPFLVRWSDGHEGLIYPGPGAVLRISAPASHEDSTATPEASSATGGDTRHHVHDWQVRISILGSDDETDAHVLLVADPPRRLSASGHSERSPHDLVTPEIGEEVAVARALRRLADQLLETAEGDIEVRTGEHDVTLRPR